MSCVLCAGIRDCCLCCPFSVLGRHDYFSAVLDEIIVASTILLVLTIRWCALR